ncbi:putative ABC transporter ATP-binding protein YvrA [Halobacillus andaensis]|uniref:ABC transporter ATP-binding protein YvrA n=1 Tax=Halobacillus andaensis TaxID=1176239 RepID=A0A917B8A5_HALAA|nr:adenosylcobinamide amidohydrolase [Halobacillus andaensis]MBP2005183.1 iron complex transport system ATP-binding protein [Halobacillus andaensis]GGF29501.1 putative ABC transporter ATP-binding protein YvrA [Halobacillus andaensis]
MIEVQNVSGGYEEKPIVVHVDFSVSKGEFFGVVGPNGCGKTTLFKMMSGVLPLWSGTVSIDSRTIDQYDRKSLARKVATLPQIQQSYFTYSVDETVMMGRYAYQSGLFKQPSAEDEQVVERILHQMGLTQMRHLPITELSGGERQRVYLAQALSQEPDVLLLDEPTNHLDFSYQKQLLDELKQLTLTDELTVVSIFHDLNIASLYCDRLLLMEEGSIKKMGTPDAVMQKELLEGVYQSTIDVYANPSVASPQMNVMPGYLSSASSELSSELLQVSDEKILFQVKRPLKTFSSAVVGAGFGWYQNFVNYHVDKNFTCDAPDRFMKEKFHEWGLPEHETLAMMTAANVTNFAKRYVCENNFTLLVLVTAGTSNAVDVLYGAEHGFVATPGTVNTWVFVEGELSEQAFIQAVVTATEAKTKAFTDCEITDQLTGTMATGTSTDSILIASTQTGEHVEYAGPVTALGSTIGRAVYEATVEAIKNSFQGKRV